MNRPIAIKGVVPAEEVWFTVDGEKIAGRRCESVAAALLAAGQKTLRFTVRNAEPRGYFCGMGVCWECTVNVVGVGNVEPAAARHDCLQITGSEGDGAPR